MTTGQEQTLAVSVAEAVRVLCEAAGPERRVVLPIEESLGRVLAEDFRTPFPMPRFRRAAMDGYALRADETLGATVGRPVALPVTAGIRAGDPPPWTDDLQQSPRDAVRVFTGAPVPRGYDTVVMQEAVKAFETEDRSLWIRIDREHPSGKHIAEAGEDMPAGKLALARGTVVGAKEIAVLASYGQRHATVYAKPRVVVVSVGDELTAPGAPLADHRIYDANGLAVHAFAKQLGADVVLRPPVSDHLPSLAREIELAAAQADVVVTTGGISVGDYDYVSRAAERAGWTPAFNKVLMRPGTPTSAFKSGNRLLIALSGNPSACYSGLELIVRPLLQRLKGMANYKTQWLRGRLEEGVGKPCPYPRYIRSAVRWELDHWEISPLAGDRSGNIAAFPEANAIAVIPSGGRGAAVGEWVPFLQLTHPANGGLA